MAQNKILRWFNGKNDESQEDYYTKSTDGRPYKIQWQKPHETNEKELWKNNTTLGKSYQSIRHRKDDHNNGSNRKHYSLPVPPRKNVEQQKPTRREIAVDPRRFGMVDPFVFYGKNFTLDNSDLDSVSYFNKQIQKEVETMKQNELNDSSEIENNSITSSSASSVSTSESINKSFDEKSIRSRRESQQSTRRD
ncbi:hypothetical protein C1645_747543, partial [Glomus cerebriforme]